MKRCCILPPCHVDTSGLCDVVAGLLLGVVGNVAGHGRSDDEAAGATLLEVVADCLGAVKGTVQVSLDDLHPVVDSAVKNTRGSSATSVGNKLETENSQHKIFSIPLELPSWTASKIPS